jgi:hypothetical protein
MFSFFKKKSLWTRKDDKLWVKKAAKYKGICDDLPKTLPIPEPFYFVITFFKQTQKELQVIFDYKQTDYEVLDETTGFEWMLVKPRKIYLADARIFENRQFSEMADKIFFTGIYFFFAEHYPKFSEEEKIFNWLNERTQKTEIRFYASLEDPFFNIFGSENLKETMYKLGMTDEESISSPMINRSIENAQKKIDTKVTAEIKTNSPEEWVKINMR